MIMNNMQQPNTYNAYVTYDNTGQAYYFDKETMKMSRVDNRLLTTDQNGKTVYNKEYAMKVELFDQYGQMQQQQQAQEKGLGFYQLINASQNGGYIPAHQNATMQGYVAQQPQQQQMYNQQQQMFNQGVNSLDQQIANQMQQMQQAQMQQQMQQQAQIQQPANNFREAHKEFQTVKAVSVDGTVVEILVDQRLITDVLATVEIKIDEEAESNMKAAQQQATNIQQQATTVPNTTTSNNVTKPDNFTKTVKNMPSINREGNNVQAVQQQATNMQQPVMNNIPQQATQMNNMQQQATTVPNTTTEQQQQFKPDPNKSKLQNFVDQQASMVDPGLNKQVTF